MSLLEEYKRFEEIYLRYKNENKIDFSTINFVYPSFILPLYYLTHGKNCKMVPNKQENVNSYIVSVLGNITGNKNNKSTLCPITFLPKDESLKEKVIEKFSSVFENGKYSGGQNAFLSYIGEISDNIYQHSKFSNAYILGQRYPSKKFIEICIVDNGITIPKNFEENKIIFEKDYEAIFNAINGTTTKKDFQRGYGLCSSINMIVKGLNGEFLIASRKGVVYITPKEIKTYEIKMFKGTLIAFRIPLSEHKLDIYKYADSKGVQIQKV
ncbi:MAG: ATP-binding protein [Bacteroidales bacterium]|nr:ATP-binding protein [Bacteroidales bacterium]